MMDVTFSQIPTWPPLAVSVMIFVARIFDVSLGTFRIIVVSRGGRLTASILGFFEVLIWLFAIGQVMANLNGLLNYIMYCSGFATGTFVGMTIERRYQVGKSILQVIVPQKEWSLAKQLIAQGHRITYLNAESVDGPVEVIFAAVKPKALRELINAVKRYEPDAFYSIEDVRYVSEPVPMHSVGQRYHNLLQPFYWFRKSK